MGQAHRFSGPGGPYEGLTRARKRDGKVDWSGVVRLVPSALDEPLRMRRPQRWFVNSMSDLFHDGLTNEEIAAVFVVMAAAPQHTFLALTKRAERMRRWFEWAQAEAMMGDHWGRVPQLTEICAREFMPVDRLPAVGEAQPWPLSNVWLGVSVEDQETADERIPFLLEAPAAVRYVSYEPALGPIDFRGWMRPRGLDWVIVGGESGPGARPFALTWARSTVQACRQAGVPVFVKQLGSMPVDDGGTILRSITDRKGGEPSEWPEDLRVREMPEVRR
jgi:protein gp37